MDNDSGATNTPLRFCYSSTYTESPYGLFIYSKKKWSKIYEEYINHVENNFL